MGYLGEGGYDRHTELALVGNLSGAKRAGGDVTEAYVVDHILSGDRALHLMFSNQPSKNMQFRLVTLVCPSLAKASKC